jgi:hypothetical protein
MKLFNENKENCNVTTFLNEKFKPQQKTNILQILITQLYSITQAT